MKLLHAWLLIKCYEALLGKSSTLMFSTNCEQEHPGDL